MDYGKVIRRAANIVWNHKFLMVLGFLAALGGGSTFNVSNSSGNGGSGFDPPGRMPRGGEFPFNGPFPGQFDVDPQISALALVAICVGFVLALVIFVVSNVARGGLVAAVDDIAGGGRSTFAEAWSTGWERAATLLGIGIIPAIPFFFLFLVGFLGFLGMVGVRAVGGSGAPLGAPLGGLIGALTCLMVPLSLILGLLRTFANRAAMLEGAGAVDAYGRGLSVLRANLGEGVLLFLLQIAISIGLSLLLLVPGIFVALCCLLWPLLILFQGAMAAFFSALWTLAWREWTGSGKVLDKMQVVA